VNLLVSVIVRQAHKSGAAGKAGRRLLTDWNAVAGGMFLGVFDCGSNQMCGLPKHQ
jgi:hypothetical protein